MKRNLVDRFHNMTMVDVQAIIDMITDVMEKQNSTMVTRLSIAYGMLELSDRLGFDTYEQDVVEASEELSDAIFQYILRLRAWAADES